MSLLGSRHTPTSWSHTAFFLFRFCTNVIRDTASDVLDVSSDCASKSVLACFNRRTIFLSKKQLKQLKNIFQNSWHCVVTADRINTMNERPICQCKYLFSAAFTHFTQSKDMYCGDMIMHEIKLLFIFWSYPFIDIICSIEHNSTLQSKNFYNIL